MPASFASRLSEALDSSEIQAKLLAKVVELVLGQSFDAFMREVAKVVGVKLAELKVDIDRIDKLNMTTTGPDDECRSHSRRRCCDLDAFEVLVKEGEKEKMWVQPLLRPYAAALRASADTGGPY